MKRSTINLGGQQLTVYVASKPEEWRAGLQGQRLGGVDGMLFKFPYDVDFAFSPKGVGTPILVAWFAGNGGFIDIGYLAPRSRPCRPPRTYRYALELVGRHATPAGAHKLIEPLAGGLGWLLR